MAEDIGVTWNGTATVAHVLEQWRTVISDVTIQGFRENTILSDNGRNSVPTPLEVEERGGRR